MTGILYAVGEIAAFMVAATIVGFLLGRVTKRRTQVVSGDNGAELASAQEALRELEAERTDLREQLRDAKERTRLLAAETTSEERSEGFAEAKRKLEQKLADAEAQADRLRATIAERDSRIAALVAGETPPEPIGNERVGYSHSAGSFAETKIIFSEEDE